MKKAIAILLATAALMASVSTASAQDKWVFNHMGFGVSAGLDGFGADLVFPLTPFFQIRGGYAMQPLSFDINKMSTHVTLSKANGDVWNLDQDVTPNVSANLDAAHLFLDIYPGKKTGLHITVGAYYGIKPDNGGPYRISTNPLEIDESDKGSVGINLDSGGKLTTDKEGRLMLDLDLANPLAEKAGLPANIYPYLGIGFGRNLRSSRIAFTMDLGAIYTGRLALNGYDYSRSETAGVQKTPIYAADISALSEFMDEAMVNKVQSLYGKVEKCPVAPILKFNLFFRIF